MPVIVEGPFDAVAVTLAGQGHYTGIAPLGTSLTLEQTRLLPTGVDPVLATDADAAGTRAADNAFWTLATRRFDPLRVDFPAGGDPADQFMNGGDAALRKHLEHTSRQADHMLRAVGGGHTAANSLQQRLEILAARSTETWETEVARLAAETGESVGAVNRGLLERASAWTRAPLKARLVARDLGRRTPEPAQAGPAVSDYRPPAVSQSSAVPHTSRGASAERSQRWSAG